MNLQKATANETVRTLPKGHLRCFHCKKVLASKDGEWRSWTTLQAFFCKECDRETAKRPERRK